MGHENDANAEDMARFFQEVGWTASKVGDTDWEVRYRGDVRDWIFYVRMTDFWVYFYATVLNKIKDECRANVYEHIGRLNYKISLAKYSINASDGISLGVELPRENFKVASFVNDALNALSINADEQYLELVNIANDPSKESSLRPKPEDEAATPPPTTTTTSPAEDTDVDWSADDSTDSSGSSTIPAFPVTVPPPTPPEPPSPLPVNPFTQDAPTPPPPPSSDDSTPPAAPSGNQS